MLINYLSMLSINRYIWSIYFAVTTMVTVGYGGKVIKKNNKFFYIFIYIT